MGEIGGDSVKFTSITKGFDVVWTLIDECWTELISDTV